MLTKDTPPLAVAVGAQPGHVGSARTFAAARAPSVEDRAELAAARGKLLVRLLCLDAGERCGGERCHSSARANRILGVSHWWWSSPRHYTGRSLRGSVAETSGDRMKGERMISRSMVRRALGLCIAGAATACANASSTLGNDPSSRTTASAVTWSDGKPAISISCEQPGGCQTRAVAMCKGPNYTVLSMENMPTRGDMTMVRGAASVVIRCA
jgi:hypothetical protein